MNCTHLYLKNPEVYYRLFTLEYFTFNAEYMPHIIKIVIPLLKGRINF